MSNNNADGENRLFSAFSPSANAPSQEADFCGPVRDNSHCRHFSALALGARTGAIKSLARGKVGAVGRRMKPF